MSLRRLSGNALAAIVNVIASAGLLFALYRFLAAEIGAEGIGVFSIVMAVSSAARLGDFGIGSGVVKFVANDLGAGRPASAAATVGFATAAVALFMSVLCVLLLPLLELLLGAALHDPADREAAFQLLPWALGSLWLGGVAGSFGGALDGAQRTDLRTAVFVGAGLAQLLAAWLLVPAHGLVALGPVQLVLGGVSCAGGAIATAVVLRQAPRHWLGIGRGRALELLRYGGGFQLAALGMLAFEPTLKWLLGLFGTLTLNGFFELANRAVLQLRQVIAAAYQMLVPFVAARLGDGTAERARLAHLYGRAWRLLVLLAIPWFAIVACVLPALLSVWIGRHESVFVAIGFACLAGWALNTVALPAFVLYLAIGRLRWSILTQVTIGALNLLLASAGGLLAGGIGVIAGAMLALALGSVVVVIAFHREHAVPLRTLVAGPTVPLLAAAVVCIAASRLAATDWSGTGLPPPALLAPPAAMLLIAATVGWRDPMRLELAGRLRR